MSGPQVPTPRRRLSPALVVLLAAALVVVCAVTAGGVASVVGFIRDDSRPSLTLADVVRDDLPGFDGAPAPSADACGDRFGCVEGVVGDGVALYRYGTLDLARQAIVFDDGDVFRSDRIVVAFDGSLSDDERYRVLQVLEGTWTRSES